MEETQRLGLWYLYEPCAKNTLRSKTASKFDVKKYGEN
jgi:hypothetical protein